MNKGIRISAHKNLVTLSDILKEIQRGDQLFLSILFLYAMGDLGQSVPLLENEINGSKNGLPFAWENLVCLASKFYDIMDITIIGSHDVNLLHRFESNEAMYEICDIVIEMIDSSYWIIFAKDEKLIEKLAKRFNVSEFMLD